MSKSESLLARPPRRKTREVKVGTRVVGGDNPIWVQSMTVADTADRDAVIREVRALEAAGCELIRVTVPNSRGLANVPAIKAAMTVPFIADIHFNHRMALGAIEAGVDKIRINPGNLGGLDKFREVVRAARDKGVPMRIGVNSGSLEKDLLQKYGFPCPEAFCESALRYVSICEEMGYRDIILSVKSTDVYHCVASYRRLAGMCDYPFHIGVTEAGMGGYGVVKSAVGLGQLLMEGIGDTIRVSLTGDALQEIPVCFDILKATGRRILSPEVIACPTCGRVELDLEKAVREVESRLREKGIRKPLRISILGCVVNGPGEAREADIGIAVGGGVGVIFKRGEPVRRVKQAEFVDALIQEIENWDEEKPSAVGGQPSAILADR